MRTNLIAKAVVTAEMCMCQRWSPQIVATYNAAHCLGACAEVLHGGSTNCGARFEVQVPALDVASFEVQVPASFEVHEGLFGQYFAQCNSSIDASPPRPQPNGHMTISVNWCGRLVLAA